MMAMVRSMELFGRDEQATQHPSATLRSVRMRVPFWALLYLHVPCLPRGATCQRPHREHPGGYCNAMGTTGNWSGRAACRILRPRCAPTSTRYLCGEGMHLLSRGRLHRSRSCPPNCGRLHRSRSCTPVQRNAGDSLRTPGCQQLVRLPSLAQTRLPSDAGSCPHLPS